MKPKKHQDTRELGKIVKNQTCTTDCSREHGKICWVGFSRPAILVNIPGANNKSQNGHVFRGLRWPCVMDFVGFLLRSMFR